MAVCTSCEHENPAGALECAGCGRALRPPAAARQERKTVTALFCDLVGFTQLAEEMDPEDVASLLGPYHAGVREELERFGGTVEKFIGDAVMGLFGAPASHEDDPERAVRAALEIREFADREGIELRIGIATGTALVSLGARPDLGETTATGDVVNTAARIQAAAPVNGLLVSERTHEATKDAIEYRRAEPVEAKGKVRPVPVWEAVGVLAETGADRETPFVGREDDLRLLEDALARVERERSCQLVTIVGVPGIGKSRLLRELEKHRDDVLWRHGRCLPYGDGITFWALGEIVKTQAGILESDTREQAEAKLERAAPDDEWVRESVRPLVGLDVVASGDADRREEAFVAWRRFLDEGAEQQTLALVFEDLHWADDDLLDFLDHLVEWSSAVPMLVIGTARPELLERRPGWGGGKTNALTASLSPLSDDETAQLIGRLIERAVMPADAQAALLARAGGNPLYAEQFVRMVVERAVAELTVPETVQGIIAARLDLLGPTQKALLQDAAVVGKTFWLGALAATSGRELQDIEASLHALERNGFVRRRRMSSVQGDAEYGFLHLLVQEVAYGQLPRAARAERHRLAAGWIESLARPGDHAEMLAYHYGEALDLAQAARLEPTGLEARARQAFRDAGDRAYSLHAYDAALRFYERALELWPEDDPERPTLLFRRARTFFLGVDQARFDLIDEAQDALLAQGDRENAAEVGVLGALARRNAGLGRAALEQARSAAALLDDAPPSEAKARVLADWARLLAVTFSDEAIEASRGALAMAEELGLDEVRAMALNSLGIARVSSDDLGGLDDVEESLRLALEYGAPFELFRIHNNLSFCLIVAGRLEREREVSAANVELARRYGLDIVQPTFGLAFGALLTGRWPEARSLIDALGAETGPEWARPQRHLLRAHLLLAGDDLAGAARECATAEEIIGGMEESSDAFEDLAVSLNLRLRLALVEGRMDVAEQLADEVEAVVRRHEHLFELILVELALLFAEFGRSQALVLERAAARPGNVWLRAAGLIASGDLVAAADRLAALEAPFYEAWARAVAGAQLVAQGRRGEADEQLQRALPFYQAVGATRYVRQCEALLEEVKAAAG